MAKACLFSNAVLREMYEHRLMSIRAISKETGLSEASVVRRLKQVGAKMRDKRSAWELAAKRKMPTLTHENVHRLYEVDGHTMNETCAILGVCKDTLRRFMRENGIRIRKTHFCEYAESRYGLSLRSERQLASDYANEHASESYLATRFAVSRKTVQKVLRKYGVPLRAHYNRKPRESCSKAA